MSSRNTNNKRSRSRGQRFIVGGKSYFDQARICLVDGPMVGSASMTPIDKRLL